MIEDSDRRREDSSAPPSASTCAMPGTITCASIPRDGLGSGGANGHHADTVPEKSVRDDPEWRDQGVSRTSRTFFRQGRGVEGFWRKIDAGIEDAAIDDGIVRIARHVKHLDPRAHGTYRSPDPSRPSGHDDVRQQECDTFERVLMKYPQGLHAVGGFQYPVTLLPKGSHTTPRNSGSSSTSRMSPYPGH